MAQSIPKPPARRRRRVGFRLYLALAFAGVALVAAGIAYLLVSDSSEEAADERAVEITVGRTVRLADRIGDRPRAEPGGALADVVDPGFSAWVLAGQGELLTSELSHGVLFEDVPLRTRAVQTALNGSDFVEALPGGRTLVAAPIFRRGRLDGAVVVDAKRPSDLQVAISEIRGDRLTAAVVAVLVAAGIGLLIATAITSRLKRLAEGAAMISEGRLDEPLEETGGRDEIADLGAALETMRVALGQTFGALSSERDRLSAIFDALDDAVLVAGEDGEVRFANVAAEAMIGDDRRVPEALRPWLRRAEHRGSAEHPGLRSGDHVWALNARRLPAEGAVLAVVRDRTDELRREVAEREFVSNAAHELRNPIAGISGAVEVLRAGAKDDPEAREHFLHRLADDAGRVSRLTESLLTLARMESVGEGGVETLDVRIALEDALRAAPAPDGVEVRLEVAADVTAVGDPILVRQVLVGLLTNAFKNTPAPGVVTLGARSQETEHVLIEVSDTGTGIAPEEINRIFERFYRGTGSLKHEGFGLGLSIARRMVDVMGGELGVESKLGQGSTFWVKLRAGRPAATPVA